MPIPKFDELFNPLLEALRNLGGSGSNAELVDQTAQIIGLSDEDLEEQTAQGQNRFAYRLAWARSYLKRFGLITNSERGIWSLTQRGSETQTVDPDEVKRFARSHRRPRAADTADAEVDDASDTEGPDAGWRETLLELLLGLAPTKFERLCQRILRESGFVQVEVTGKSGDGGIDGCDPVSHFSQSHRHDRPYRGGAHQHVHRPWLCWLYGYQFQPASLCARLSCGGAKDQPFGPDHPPVF